MPQLTAPEIVTIAKQLEQILAANGVQPPNQPSDLPGYLKTQLTGKKPPAWNAQIFSAFIDRVNRKFKTHLDAADAPAKVTIGDVLQAIVNERESKPAPYWP